MQIKIRRMRENLANTQIMIRMNERRKETYKRFSKYVDKDREMREKKGNMQVEIRRMRERERFSKYVDKDKNE